MAELKQNTGDKEGVMQKFGADEIIMREGENCDAMYKVLSGSVVIYIQYGKKNEHIWGIYSKSRCFGEMNIFSDLPCVYTAVAYDEVVLMKITKNSLEKFVMSYPKNAIDIMSSMAQNFYVMQKNVQLLLDDIYEKDNGNRKRTKELMDKIMQYGIRGQSLDRFL